MCNFFCFFKILAYICCRILNSNKMTRINSAIPVKCLTDEHLLAEHREIKRLPYNLKKALESGSVKKIPKEFKLGRGHVLFFLDKQKFVQDRYSEIFNECVYRGFDVQCYITNWKVVPTSEPLMPTTSTTAFPVRKL